MITNIYLAQIRQQVLRGMERFKKAYCMNNDCIIVSVTFDDANNSRRFIFVYLLSKTCVIDLFTAQTTFCRRKYSMLISNLQIYSQLSKVARQFYQTTSF